MSKINVFIVDDHDMFREGMRILLSKSENFEVVGEAENGKLAIERIDDTVDIVLMDIAMPEMNGIEATQILLDKYPSIKIIALSMFGDELYYYKMIHAGVQGFVLKESGSKEIEIAIDEVYSGSNFFSHELLRNVVVGIGDAKPKEVQETIPEFSEDELSILKNLTTGMAEREIAKEMESDYESVCQQIQQILNKTQCSNTVGLIIYVIRNGIVNIG